jgi:hypothetical protein
MGHEDPNGCHFSYGKRVFFARIFNSEKFEEIHFRGIFAEIWCLARLEGVA